MKTLVVLALVAICNGHRIHYRNNCNKEIWVGILGNSIPDQGKCQWPTDNYHVNGNQNLNNIQPFGLSFVLLKFISY